MFNYAVDAGLMITASHNGPEYNGIKICLGKDSVWGQALQEVKELYHQKKELLADISGSYTEYPVIPDYIAWLKDHFSHLVGMELSAVVDCGNGAGGTVMPELLKAMEWPNVQLLYPEVDGTYPNHQADPIVEKNMLDVKKLLKETSIEVGLGLDGDCDRMTPMTKEGELVQGDKLLALFAKGIIKDIPEARVIFDIKCSSGLPELLTKWGATPVISPSGHSIIKKMMKEHQGSLAGELSCHFFFNDRYFGYDDGIYAAMRLFELLHQTKKSLHELLKLFPATFSTPEIRMECAQERMDSIVAAVRNTFEKRTDIELLTIDGIRVTTPYGWGILRSSNTQPVLCIRFEGNSPEGLQKIRDDFYAAMEPHFNPDELNETLHL